jgi:hypothetical protein
MRLSTTFVLIVWSTLALPGCNNQPEFCDACSRGQMLCDQEGKLIVCDGPDDDGCFSWGPPRSCPAGQICRGDGGCVCANPCTSGENMCGDEGGQLTCEEPDDDGCTSWGSEASCAEPEGCVGGSCGCLNPCDLGETQCNSEGKIMTCAGPDGEGCAFWETPVSCKDHQVCSQGACACQDPCRIGDRVCADGGGISHCEGPDPGGCFFWTHPLPCSEGTVCNPAKIECMEQVPPECEGLNQCDYIGQKLCMSETKYRSCKVGDGGCLEWDCST